MVLIRWEWCDLSEDFRQLSEQIIVKFTGFYLLRREGTAGVVAAGSSSAPGQVVRSFSLVDH